MSSKTGLGHHLNRLRQSFFSLRFQSLFGAGLLFFGQYHTIHNSQVNNICFYNGCETIAKRQDTAVLFFRWTHVRDGINQEGRFSWRIGLARWITGSSAFAVHLLCDRAARNTWTATGGEPNRRYSQPMPKIFAEWQRYAAPRRSSWSRSRRVQQRQALRRRDFRYKVAIQVSAIVPFLFFFLRGKRHLMNYTGLHKTR